MSYLSWEKFHSTIKFQLNKRRIARDSIKDFVALIIPEYQRLKEISADIPQHILENIKNNKKKLKDMQVPYMLNGFHPVKPYQEQEVEEDDADNDGLINIGALNLDYDNTEV